MTNKVLIRSETSADVGAIDKVTVAAFKTLAISHHTEQFIVAALRAAGALTVSLVAEVDGRVVGHIAFSPVTMSDGSPNWYGLGPVSVWPECQRRRVTRAWPTCYLRFAKRLARVRDEKIYEVLNHKDVIRP